MQPLVLPFLKINVYRKSTDKNPLWINSIACMLLWPGYLQQLSDDSDICSPAGGMASYCADMKSLH